MYASATQVVMGISRRHRSTAALGRAPRKIAVLGQPLRTFLVTNRRFSHETPLPANNTSGIQAKTFKIQARSSKIQARSFKIQAVRNDNAGDRFKGFPESEPPKTESPKKSPKTESPRFRTLLLIAAAFSAAYLTDEHLYASTLQRSARAIYVLSSVALKYYRTPGGKHLEQLHEEASESILALINHNKGLYIKVGQAIANQSALFPMAFQRRFTALYDDAPMDSWARVDAVLKANLGADYETTIFSSFDHQPVASASIAQVHRAVLKKSGQQVAVKVQHPYISRQIGADLLVYNLMSRLYTKVFDIPFNFTDYVSEQLEKEADFHTELANSQRLRSLIQNDHSADYLNVYIPECYPEYSSDRVFTAEWIDGMSLTDKQLLIEKNVSLSWLMKQYTEIFGKQIFHYGFVHSDPHPGNMLVRFHQGSQQLVILDHGLYISLPERFMQEYRELWRNLLGFESAKIDRITKEWGIRSSELLKALVQLKPPTKTKPQEAPSSIDLMRNFLEDETKFPPALIFLSRTMRMMQTLNQTMGSPVNRINLLTKVALEGNGSGHGWMALLSLIKVRISLLLSDVFFLYLRAKQVLKGDRYGEHGEGLEDYIDQYLRENAKAMGIHLS